MMQRKQMPRPSTPQATDADSTRNRRSAPVEEVVDAPQKSRLRQNVESFGVAILAALMIRSSVVEAFWVPSGSMLPTIQIGDHLFVNKLAYGAHIPFTSYEVAHWSPLQRNEIIVFVSPVDRKIDLIKRVIAVGGDTVEVRNKRLYINGEAVPDDHATFTEPGNRMLSPRDNYGPVTVPAGKFFVMGDNRDHSYDSRFWGFADEKDVKGRATFIYWSWDSDNWFPRLERFGHFIR